MAATSRKLAVDDGTHTHQHNCQQNLSCKRDVVHKNGDLNKKTPSAKMQSPSP